MTALLWNVAAYAVQLSALVIVALVAVAALRIRMPRPSLRFWQSVMAIALLLPFAQPWREAAAVPQIFMTATGAINPTRDVLAAKTFSAFPLILGVIALGIVARLGWLAFGLWRVRSLVANARLEPACDALIDELGSSLGVRATVMVSDTLEGPATLGIARPIVLIPPSVLAMSARVQCAILCHELIHVQRRDWLHTIGEELWCAVLWFHPLARVIASRLSLARETVVDERTILLTRDRRAYAEALLAFSNPQPHVIGVTPFIGRRTLSQRISLIAEEVPMSRRRALFSATIALAASIVTTAAAVDRFPMSTAPQAGQVYSPGNGVTLPTVVHEVKPEYTPEAMQQKIQGSVWMKVVIGETGDVTDVQIDKSLDAEYGLDRKATEAAYQWKFKPGTKDGKAVAVRVTVEMTFTLKK
jgi:TonB family protein